MENRISLLAHEMVVHFSTETSCLCSRDHFVFRYCFQSQKLRFVCRIPPKDSGLLGLLKDVLARSWLGQRLSKKAGLSHVMQLDSGLIVIIYDRVYVCDLNQGAKVATPIESKEFFDFAPPLRNGYAIHPASQAVYFGEYLNGHTRNIRVFRIRPNDMKLEICFEFDRSEIKHIHAISYDPFRRRLWITTGDLDHESSFYYTDDEFLTVHRFAGGDQTWRAISLLFDETGMEWGMDAGKDAPKEAINKLYRYDFSTETRVELAVIGNPAYYAAQMMDGTAYLATTFEPGRLQDTPEEAALWHRDMKHQWTKVKSFRYVYAPRQGVSKYGHLLLPAGKCSPENFLMTPVNVESNHYSLVKLQP